MTVAVTSPPMLGKDQVKPKVKSDTRATEAVFSFEASHTEQFMYALRSRGLVSLTTHLAVPDADSMHFPRRRNSSTTRILHNSHPSYRLLWSPRTWNSAPTASL